MTTSYQKRLYEIAGLKKKLEEIQAKCFKAMIAFDYCNNTGNHLAYLRFNYFDERPKTFVARGEGETQVLAIRALFEDGLAKINGDIE